MLPGLSVAPLRFSVEPTLTLDTMPEPLNVLVSAAPPDTL